MKMTKEKIEELCVMKERIEHSLKNEITRAKVESDFSYIFEQLSLSLEEAKQLCDNIFALLLSDKSLLDIEGEIFHIFESIKFKADDKKTNLIEVLHKKMRDRVKIITSQVAQYLKDLKGKTIDYGAGDGQITQELHDHLGLDIEGVDVRLYKASNVTVPITLLNSDRVEVADGIYEAALLTNVLHHEKANEKILNELDRIVSSKLVIIDTVPVGETEEVMEQDKERTFMNDYLHNRLFHNDDVPVPGTFETPKKWVGRFVKHGWKLVNEKDLGFDQPIFKLRHYLFVFEKEKISNNMKITILNKSFFNESYLSALHALGDLTIYKNTYTEEEVIERLKDVDIAIADCNTMPLNKKVLESTDTLKFLVIQSTGYDLVDIATAKDRGIQVANVPEFSTEAVAEHTIALILAISKKIPVGDKMMRQTPFQINPTDQEHKKYLGFNLAGKTLGIVGFGNIGLRVAQIGIGFGMNVLVYDRLKKNVENIKQVSLETLLRESDIVSLHLPLTPETENLITAERLQMMKSTSILINTARGKIVDELALYNVLQSRKIAGAGLDLIVEWKKSNPLLKLDNVVFSPHSAFFTNESLSNCAEIIVANVKSFIEGKAINIVNS